MLLAGLILLAACANLGSLFAARAADRAKDTALRLALGSKRTRILRKLLTEAILISLAGGVIGSPAASSSSTCSAPGSPFRCPINVPVNPTFALTGRAPALARKRIPMRHHARSPGHARRSMAGHSHRHERPAGSRRFICAMRCSSPRSPSARSSSPPRSSRPRTRAFSQ